MKYLKISYDFLEKHLRFASSMHIQIFLYIKYIFEKDNKVPSLIEISEELDIPQNRVKYALGYWASQGLIKLDGDVYSVIMAEDEEVSEASKTLKPSVTPSLRARMRPSYKSEEIKPVIEKNPALSSVLYAAENILGELSSGNTIELIYSFYDWLGLPPEVIIMILTYAKRHNKTNKRYLETLAIDWADKGIDTYEKAEEYIKQLEFFESEEHKIRSILGIYDRSLTKTEKNYFDIWIKKLKLSPELIALAYEKTVENTGKLAYSYMNKILQNWHDEQLLTVEDVKNQEMLYEQNKVQQGKGTGNKKSSVRKSKFNNFENNDKTDCDDLERKLLDMFLDND